jgi:GAF domain-containing protein
MPREALIVQTLVELADNLVDNFDVVELLSMLSARCVTALEVSAAGVMLATPGGDLQVMASSSETMRVLELFELQADEGPCVDCYRRGLSILNVDLSTVRERWPRFAARAIDDGFQLVHALPMHLRGRTVGAFNLFQADPSPLGEADVVAAQALADVATIALLQHQSAASAQLLNAQLSEALNSRIIIEQAKGRISEAAVLDMDESFRRLRSHARNHGLRLADLARQIADGTVNPQSLDPLLPLRATRPLP